MAFKRILEGNTKTPYLFGETSDVEDHDTGVGILYEIDFWKPKKLSDDVVAFKIRNADRDVVGYAVASSTNSNEILGTDYGEMKEQTDIDYLKKQLQKFCQVYYAQKSES